MDISVVILSFNSAKFIEKCLSSLTSSLKQSERDFEIFVVDNGSKDGTLEILSRIEGELEGRLTSILLSHNTGTTYSRNQALKQAKGKYILVLDSDAYMNEPALTGLSQYLDEHPNCGMAVPRVTYGSGNYQLSCDTFPTLWKKFQRFLFLKNMEEQESDLSKATVPVNVDYAISACWMLKRETLEKVGLLDEKIFYSPEDVDYCLRVWEAGYVITYVPSVSVIHDAQELSRGFKLTKFHFSHLKGLFYLMYKHKYFWGLSSLYKRLGKDT
ncbi:glycosyltransferase family 2 protein [Paraglaciecola aquimarina]|uniref:Glycosyltransferase family 2 protein n=1 Tax=Paraglaciecola aquimarina TaxID=1235557 RepID=A0ABU3T288_9ALTE|nr:glycosyltransferase family 2 protein [Paraglaciecola aquimarina]MDU0356380.1 glycosyltransferase family 2 protein [Paraglaciecola aquimarina]